MTTGCPPSRSAAPTSWRDSASVSLLFEFIGQQEGKWISLFIRDHHVTISFNPPGGEWTGRHFDIKAQATAMFHEAHEDLERLRLAGRLGLPVLPPRSYGHNG